MIQHMNQNKTLYYQFFYMKRYDCLTYLNLVVVVENFLNLNITMSLYLSII